jgi:6-phosphogluconate dehydrogenase
MGGNMVRRLIRNGQQCVVYDQDLDKGNELATEGAIPAESLASLIHQLDRPSVIWIMLPAGEATEHMVNELSALLKPNDIIIDGGNSYFKDDVRRSLALKESQIRYLDVGVSGGVWGLERGYSLMIGGDPSAAEYLNPIFQTLAPGNSSTEMTPHRNKSGKTADEGYLYCGPSGAGHFVKMIHNGIEYGMMQALAEGFNILRGARSSELPKDHQYHFDLTEISEVWRRGSVVSSWLLDLIAIALNSDPQLSKFIGKVPDSGEGRWTVLAAIEEAIPAEVLSTALYVRFRSREESSFAEKLLSAMRNQFGGHLESTQSTSSVQLKPTG